MASDHAGFRLKEFIKSYLEKKGYQVKDFGTHDETSCDYPDFAHPAATAVEEGECELGIAMCGTGNGIAMTLNKHMGIRAALCWIPEISKLARQHNDANILVMPARFITEDSAQEITEVFLNTPFEGGRHLNRIKKIPTNIEVEGEVL